MAVYHETFRERIEALTGFTTINGTNRDNSISEWLTDGARELLSIIPKDKLGDMASTATVTSSFGQNIDKVSGANILAVSRNDESGVKQTCRKSFPHLASRMEASLYDKNNYKVLHKEIKILKKRKSKLQKEVEKLKEKKKK